MIRLKNKKLVIILSILLIIILVLVSLIFFIQAPKQNTPSDLGAKTPIPKIDNIVIITEENRTYKSIVGSPHATYINQLINNGASTTNYYAVSKNPYIAMTSGALTSIPNSCLPNNKKCQTQVANITDEIIQSGRTWKMYAEDMPSPCYPTNTSKYTVRHNPFIFYSSILNDKSLCESHVVPYSEFLKDIDNNLPNISFVSPNICNDMHSCSTAVGDKWLSENVPKILNSKPFKSQNSLLIITWDEGFGIDNKVLTIFLGPAAKNNYKSNEAYTHYSILHTIEYLWGLNTLTKNDANAIIMSDMLK